MKRIELTDEQIDEILVKYANNQSQQSIADQMGFSRKVIKRVLTENSDKVALRERTSKYSANYDVFENIDTPEKAYWLGFIAADGCNYQREHNASVIINIHQQDIEHLKKFKEFCNSDANITTYIATEGFSNNTPMCKLVLNSKKMSADLSDKGITPRKSLTLEPPKIDKEFYLPFIMGYFDGDGSISKTNQHNNYTMSIQGTREMLEWMNEVLGTDLPLEKRNPDEQNSYYIRCGGTNKPCSVLKQIYESCEVHLDRKYNLYKLLETVVLSRNTK